MQLKWTVTAVAMAALTLVACGKKEEAAAPAAAPAATTAAAASGMSQYELLTGLGGRFGRC